MDTSGHLCWCTPRFSRDGFFTKIHVEQFAISSLLKRPFKRSWKELEKGMVANFFWLECLVLNLFLPCVEFYVALPRHFSMFYPNTKTSKCLSKKIFLVLNGIWIQDHWMTARYANQCSKHNLAARPEFKMLLLCANSLFLVHNSWWTCF